MSEDTSKVPYLQQDCTFPASIFSEGKQDAILGHLLLDQNFFLQGVGRIMPNWFKSQYNGRVWSAMVGLYQLLGRKPTIAEVHDCREFLSEDIQIKNRLWAQMHAGQQASLLYPIDALRNEMTEWMQVGMYRRGMTKSASMFNAAENLPDGKGKVEKLLEAIHFVKTMSAEIEGTTFSEDCTESVTDYKETIARSLTEMEDGVTFGLRMMDQHLAPQAKNGGMFRGDTTILLAPSNSGKSIAMITAMVANIKNGKDVLWLSHEGRPDDLKEKMWCNYFGITRQTLYKLYADPRASDILGVGMKLIGEHLTYIPMHKAGVRSEDVVAIVRRKQEEWMATHNGKGYDMLVDDYPAKLQTEGGMKGIQPRRIMDAQTYNYFIHLALELKFHVLCAIQCNREGSKRANGQGTSDHLLRMEDVAESYETMQIASNVISINRDAIAEAKNRLTYYICKTRTGPKGVAVVCNTDFKKSTTHSDALGSTWYMGATTMADKVDQMLQQYLGQGVPMAGSVS